MTFRSTLDTPIDGLVAYQAWASTINNRRQLPRLDSVRKETNIRSHEHFSKKDGCLVFLELDDQSLLQPPAFTGKLSNQASSRTTSSGASSIT
jgi:hypothetical protein